MKVEIYKDRAGYWRWRLKAKNHKIVAESGEGYSARHKAVDAFDRLVGYGEAGDMLQALRAVSREPA